MKSLLTSSLLVVCPWLVVLGVFPLTSAMGSTAESADFYVSTEGNDTWTGRLAAPKTDRSDGPFATLRRARDAVRSLLRSEPCDITVQIRGGIYSLTETLVFSWQDSAGDHTVTYAAFPGEKPVLRSGVPIRDWRRMASAPNALPQEARGKVWVAEVADRTPFRTLYGSGGPLPRARGAGFSPVNSTPRGSQDFQVVQFPADTLTDFVNLADVDLRIVPSHFWIMNLLSLESIDLSTRTLCTAVEGTYPLGKNGMRDRDNAWIENALEVLDEPGEWVLNQSEGRLYLWPKSDTPPADVVAPTLTELIRVEGEIDYEGPADTPVTGLVFKGLTFTQADRYPWQGRTGWGLQHDWECFDKPTALLRFRGAERCVVEDCEFVNSGHTGVRLDLHCQAIRIVGNRFHELGGAGILLAGYGPGTKHVNRKNLIANNLIDHIGREYWGSLGIFVWQSGENHITHNLIHHVPYTAIAATGRIVRSRPGPAECSRTIRWHEVPEEFLRGSWEQREPYLHSRGNIIEYNEMHHAMEKLGDGNCIYISGAGAGNVVRYNFCHDCTGEYMNAVIRCDDDQHRTLMEGNVCCRTGGHGEGFISKGDNDILNNLIADLRPVHRHRGYVVFPYGNIEGSRIQRNIFFSTQADQKLYHHGQATRHGQPPHLSDADVDHNIYFCTEDPNWADALLAKQREQGNDQNSRQADPKLLDPAANDFRFAPGSPAFELGIEFLDTERMGLEPEYRERFAP
jgi:hypothetical protein